MKRVIASVLTVIMLLSVFSMLAFAEESVLSDENFEYILVEDKAVITKYIGTETTVSIPEEIDETKVSMVASNAFAGRTDLEMIFMPREESGIEFADDAFDADCAALFVAEYPGSGYFFAKEKGYELEGSWLAAPTLISAERTGDKILVTWEELEYAEKYTVYRLGEYDWEKIAETEQCSYEYTSMQEETFTVAASAEGGKVGSQSDQTGVTCEAGVVAVPAGLTAVSTGFRQITIEWEAAAGAEGYEVYRKTEESGWKMLKTVTGTSYVDKSVADGAKYFYTVKPYMTVDGEKVWGEYDETGIECTAKFVVPKLISAENTAVGQITVKWEKVAGAAGYRVYRKTEGGTWRFLKDVISASYVDKTATAIDTTYTYTIKPYAKVSGRTVWGTYDETGIDCTSEFPALQLISAENTAVGQITVKWEKIAGAEGYRVYRKAPTDTEWKSLASVSGTSYVNKTAMPDETYSYQVRPYAKLDRKTVWGPYDEAGLSCASVFPELKLVSAENTAVGQITVKWEKIAGAAGYRVYRKADGEFAWKRLASVSGTSYVDKNALLDKTYTYKVEPYAKVSGKTVYGPHDEMGLSCTSVFPELKLVSAENTAVGQITVKWEKIAGATGYRVYRKADGEFAWKRLASVSGTSYTDKNALPDNTYTYKVEPYAKVSGKTVYGPYDETGLSCISVFPELKLVSAENTAVGQITVKWEKIAGATGYRVYRKAEGDAAWKRLASVSGTSYTDKNALPDNTYTYKVEPYAKVSGKTIYGPYDEAGLSCESVFAAPKLVSAEIMSTKQCLVKWEKVAGAQKYAVYRKQDGGEWKLLGYTTGAQYTDKSIKRDVLYTYTVKAVKTINKKNVFGSFDEVGLSVKIEIPEKVELKSLNPVGIRKVTLEWEAVPGAESYIIYRTEDKEIWKRIATVKDAVTYTERVPYYDTKYTYSVSADFGDAVTGYDEMGLSIVRETPEFTGEIDPTKPMVALTYDDGPGKYTDDILDVLEKYNAKATFFVVGQNVSRYGDTVKRAYDMGCEIANHSYSHPNITSLSASKLKSEVNKTDEVIMKFTGERPKLMRPPYGSYKTNTVRSNVGKPLILWSIDTRDWEHRNAAKNLAAVKKNVKDGSIILMHDIHKPTAAAAESIVEYLVEEGYQLVTVSELAYYKDVELKNGVGYGSFK